MKSETGNVSRWLVWVGAALVIFSLFSVWLVLHEPFEVGTTIVQFRNLTLPGQALVIFRQLIGLGLGALFALCFSPVLFFGGVYLFIYYLRDWVQTQTRRERLGRMELALRQMTREEIEQERIADAQQEQMVGQPARPPARTVLEKLEEIETLAEGKLHNAFPEEKAVVLSNRRIEQVYYDFIVQFKDANDPHLLVEVVYAPRGLREGWLRELSGRMQLQLDLYHRTLNCPARALALLVTAEEPAGDVARFGRGDVRLHAVSETALRAAGKEDLLKWAAKR